MVALRGDRVLIMTPQPPQTQLRYHIPHSQVWERSAGRQRGGVHLHILTQFDQGRIHRKAGAALCGKVGWMEREPDGETSRCARCDELAKRFGLRWETSAGGIDPVCLIHGLKWSEHKGGRCLYCCLCFKPLTPEECHALPGGVLEDVCKDCAKAEVSQPLS